MKRLDVMLATLGSTDKPFEPVHLQKALFLIDKTLPELFDERYAFMAYDYGPFDAAVYSDAAQLQIDGLMEIGQRSGEAFRSYWLTDRGRATATEILEGIDDRRERVQKIAKVVTSLTFRQLVSAIYKAYPDMKANSVFKG